MVWICRGILFSFLFFLFRYNVIREQLDENDFRRYVLFPESIIPKVLDHSYVQSSLSTITSQLDNSISKTPYRADLSNSLHVRRTFLLPDYGHN